jgi:predicted ABC-type ATPase
LIVGPNGAGKSTLFEQVIKPRVAAPFINADLIQKTELADQSMQGAYVAADYAAKRRDKFLLQKKSFVTESTFSHPSKLQLIQNAKIAGFKVLVFHVSIETDDLAVKRVEKRVEEGGHDVPEEKIRSRFTRNKNLIKQAVLAADLGFVYDNSELNTKPTLLLTFNQGALSQQLGTANWAQALYGEFYEYDSGR